MIVGELMPDRPLTPEERATHDEDPRPGVWAGQVGWYYGAEEQGDLRTLTQDQTDRLIRLELLDHARSERPQVERAVGLSSYRGLRGDDCLMIRQRGGLDSDPLVRLLAYRAWGNRDQRWFELRGVRAGDRVSVLDSYLTIFGVARSVFGEQSCGIALESGRPGQSITCRIDMERVSIPFCRVTRDAPARNVVEVELDFGQAFSQTFVQRGIIDISCRVSDRLREDPALSPDLAPPSTDREAASRPPRAPCSPHLTTKPTNP